MKTYKIDKKEIEGMEISETGYKVLHYDLKGLQGDFSYGDVNENICGNVYKVDGKISLCNWGLHSCKNPVDTLYYYEPLGYSRYFKVNSYGNILHDNRKTVAPIIEFVEEYSLMEFLKLIECYKDNIDEDLFKRVFNSGAITKSYGINSSRGVNGSVGVSFSNGVSNSKGMNESVGVSSSYGVNASVAVHSSGGINSSSGVSYSRGIYLSDGIYSSHGVTESMGVCESNGVSKSCGVYDSKGVNQSEGIYCSDGVNWSKAVYYSVGVNNSKAVGNSYGVNRCKNINNCIFCHAKEYLEGCIFNTKVSESRISDVYWTLKKFDFIPDYTNIYELKNGLEWYQVNLPLVKENTIKQAWSKMPKEMLEYIVSLEEFDTDVFYYITGIDMETDNLIQDNYFVLERDEM